MKKSADLTASIANSKFIDWVQMIVSNQKCSSWTPLESAYLLADDLLVLSMQRRLKPMSCFLVILTSIKHMLASSAPQFWLAAFATTRTTDTIAEIRRMVDAV